MLDSAGRLQLPRAHVEALQLRRRVRLRLEHDHIGVWPDDGSPRREATDGDAPRGDAPRGEAPRGDAPSGDNDR